MIIRPNGECKTTMAMTTNGWIAMIPTDLTATTIAGATIVVIVMRTTAMPAGDLVQAGMKTIRVGEDATIRTMTSVDSIENSKLKKGAT